MKGIVFALSLALSVSPAMAAGVMPASYSKLEPKKYSPIPQKNAVRTAQALGYFCRNGVWYCYMGYLGPVGYACCGCNICGVWSPY